ncbi:MAG: UDP-glucose/GDP-mannose dehydrogenase family protein [Acidimicrobiia bacterium]|nr:UDP-glucose/GDP-mannose dehydrogenase family protein [Acidimicrobiia bacterium]
MGAKHHRRLSVSEVAVIGAGYVGLTTATCLAHLGHRVICADIVEERVERLSKGEVPILEDGLPALLAEGLATGRLSFVVGARKAAAVADFVFLCVPTPQADDGSADLSFVEDVTREIAPVLRRGAVVINKSTMPVGSTRLVEQILGEAGASIDQVRVASNPEFLREGTSVEDFLHPNRVVIGCDDPSVAVRVSELYRALDAPILVTDPASAEMIKYASNAFLATKISFVNAIANLCEAVDADVREVTLGMGYDQRIGFEFLHPGPGYGGSCFPKDTAALLFASRNVGYDFALLDGVVEVNRRQHERMVEKATSMVGGSLEGVTIALWGLTFKANTDDLRDSPALVIAQRLIEGGANVRAFDPAAGESAERAVPGLVVVSDPYEVCAGAALLAVLTEWDQFRWLDFNRVRDALASPNVLDTRNLLDPVALRRRGFTYEGVGRS